MATFVVAHGAWSAAWAWKKMRPLLRAAGHALWTPTYTGLGERAHLASAVIDLDTHIRDVVGVLDMEDLSDVVLIGHSYGGMVATGIADRARARIAQLVYLDAFVPRNGQSLLDLQHVHHDGRQVGGDRGAGGNLEPIEIGPAQINGFLDDLLDAAGGAVAAVKADQGAQAAHHFGGALDLRHRLLCGLRHGDGVRSPGAHGVIDQPRIGAGGH